MTLTERTANALAWIEGQLAICKAATDGPWMATESHDIMSSGSQFLIALTSGGSGYLNDAKQNATFIAASRTGFPAMLESMKVALCSVERGVNGLNDYGALTQVLALIEGLPTFSRRSEPSSPGRSGSL
jgi:hypothetical protein